MSLPLRLDVRPDPEIRGVCVKAFGEVDLSTFGVLDEQHRIRTRDCEPVRFDLSEVSFIDSSGLACLIMAKRRADEHEVPLVIGPVSDIVRAAARLAGIEEWFDGGPEGPVTRITG